MIGPRSPSFAVPALLALLLAAHAHAQQEAHFFAPRLYPIGGIPADMALVDLNGDTRLDVVATNFNQGTISVLLATENGEFESLPDALAASSPIRIPAWSTSAGRRATWPRKRPLIPRNTQEPR